MRAFPIHWISFLLMLYPRRWRDRYEEEYRTILEECFVSSSRLTLLIDIIRGALDAHLNYGQLARRMEARQRKRRRHTTFLVACVLLIASDGAIGLTNSFRPTRALLP